MAPRHPTAVAAVHTRHRPAPPGQATTSAAAPPLPTPWLPRPRLLRAVRDAVAAPVTLVSAPAGFGKTTLLVDWARALRGPVAWVSLSGRDVVADGGWSHVQRAIHRALPAVRPGAPPGADAGTPAALARAIEWLGGRFTLVLDDVDVLADDGALDMVRDLVSWLPPAARTVLIARSAPRRLALGRRRWCGELAHLGVDALAFSRDETASYLRGCWDLDLDDAVVDRVWRRTDGWPAVLRLVASEYRTGAAVVDGSALLGHDGTLPTQLLEDVLDRERADDVEWLRQCSVLEVLDPASCRHVTGDASADRLRRLADRGVLIEEPGRGHRLRRPLGDLLRRDLTNRHPAEAEDLWRRAVHAEARRGDASGAVARAASVGRETLALEVLDSHRLAVIGLDGGDTFRRLLRTRGERAVMARPRLTTTVIDLAAVARDLDGLADVRSTAGPRVGAGDVARAAEGDLDGGRAVDAEVHAEETLARLAGFESRDLTLHRRSHASAALAHLRGVQAGWDGTHPTAAKLLRAARADAVSRADPLRELAVLVDAVWERACAGRLTAADLLLRRALALVESLGLRTPPAYLELARASMAGDRGQHDLADRFLRRVQATQDPADVVLAADALMVGHRVGRGRLTAGVMVRRLAALAVVCREQCGGAAIRRLARARAAVLLHHGDVDGAAAVVPQVLAAKDHRVLPPADRVMLARLLSCRGLATRARQVADTVTVDVAGPRLAIEAAEIAATASRTAGDHAGASAALQRSRTIAASQAIATSHDPPATHPIAGRRTASSRRPGQATSDGAAVDVAWTGVGVERLTRRELMVLGLLPSRLSYKGLADELGVSVNTVKAHLKSIYRKLDAPSRRDVVERATALGLLADGG